MKGLCKIAVCHHFTLKKVWPPPRGWVKTQPPPWGGKWGPAPTLLTPFVHVWDGGTNGRESEVEKWMARGCKLTGMEKGTQASRKQPGNVEGLMKGRRVGITGDMQLPGKLMLPTPGFPWALAPGLWAARAEYTLIAECGAAAAAAIRMSSNSARSHAIVSHTANSNSPPRNPSTHSHVHFYSSRNW